METLRDGSPELQCVGKLEVVKPKPIGFICGTLPVPTDDAFHTSQAALVPSTHPKVRAPRYRMLPTETDLNNPPLVPNFPDKVFPIASLPTKPGGDLQWESGPISQTLARKGETLAVSGLAEYGDEIDVVAPADILKQIFKIPYSKARLSIAVHRIGQTLILNTGPDVEEGEKLVRRKTNQSKGVDQSIFLNFAMHSVRAEACDCPSTQYIPSEDQPSSTSLPGNYESTENSFVSGSAPFLDRDIADNQTDGFNRPAEYSQGNRENFFWGGRQKQNRQNNKHDALQKISQVGEKPRCPIQESEKHRRVSNDGFLRVLFWQFHNFRMLLGSDLLLFSNEKYVAVSLHLWDVGRQVTPLMWLEAWLDNVMASVPELAICYHQNGVVQGYELLKTDDVFLLKGICEDGTTAFHPQVVQQNGLSVLRFLQDNCKQDPGAYWLFKSAGEDVIQLFDLSVIPKNHSADDHDKGCSSLPSLMQRGRRESLFSLGTLLYRLAHRLSLSKVPNNRSKCAKLFKKCLDFLDEQEHLVVRAYAHEQFARLILRCYEELDLTSELVLLESNAAVIDVEDESSDFFRGMSGSNVQVKMPPQVDENLPLGENTGILHDSVSGANLKMTLEASLHVARKISMPGGTESEDHPGNPHGSNSKDSLTMCQISATSPHVVQTVADPISSKLAAVHHVSQAIKSFRWKRQLQDTEAKLANQGNKIQDRSPPNQFSVCACGEADCIEVCNIREWLVRCKIDHKLWKLVLLLGESYLALGQAYKEDKQLHQALKVVELACSVYGSMPLYLEDAKFISSMVSSSWSQPELKDRNGMKNPVLDGMAKLHSGSSEESLNTDRVSPNYLFWAKAWTLVGDVYVEFHRIKGEEISVHPERKASGNDLKMSTEVLKEVKRLKKKLGQFQQNCSTCSLINCSCQSDRASSGNSASSSSGDSRSLAYGRKQIRKSSVKSSLHACLGSPEDDSVNSNGCLSGSSRNNRNGDACSQTAQHLTGELEVNHLAADSSGIKETSEVRFEPKITDVAMAKSGGIFTYLVGPKLGDLEYNLSVAMACYDEAKKAMSGFPISYHELQSVVRKKGWVCNELGRCRLDNGSLGSAELAFADAIQAFREVEDHTNIILINCNLGHGRRALAEDMVSKLEHQKKYGIFFQKSYEQTIQTAKLEYAESLRFYGAARLELTFVQEGAGSVSTSLWNEVWTQSAHTYLRLGMLLASEDLSAEIYDSVGVGELSVGHDKVKNELRKHEISANDAIREALCMYESLGDLRKQEAAFAYFQLACYHRDCCLRVLEPEHSQVVLSRGENNHIQKVKRYASLAERNWQKSIDFYGPNTHPVMYLTILMERSALSLSLSSYFHSNMMLDSTLSHLLEGRHTIGYVHTDSSSTNALVEVEAKFRNQLQALLKRMLSAALSANPSKSSTDPTTQNRLGDVGKLRELYRMSLKSTGLAQLPAMYELWAS